MSGSHGYRCNTNLSVQQNQKTKKKNPEINNCGLVSYEDKTSFHDLYITYVRWPGYELVTQNSSKVNKWKCSSQWPTLQDYPYTSIHDPILHNDWDNKWIKSMTTRSHKLQSIAYQSS